MVANLRGNYVLSVDQKKALWVNCASTKGEFRLVSFFSVLFETASCFALYIFTIACFLIVIIKKGEIIGFRELKHLVLLTCGLLFNDNKHY